MGFQTCHPAINFIYFACVIAAALLIQHPAYLIIALLGAFAYAVRLRPGTLEQALSCLKSAGITPLAVYRHTQEGYREAAE